MRGSDLSIVPAQAPTFRTTFAIIAVYAALVLALWRVAATPGPVLPGFNGFFSAGIFVADLATSYLLLVRLRRTPTWSVLLLAAAYFYSSLMAIPYLLVFPDAVRVGGPVLGTAQSIAYVLTAWNFGYAALAATAVAAQAWWPNAQIERQGRAVAIGAVATVGTIALFAYLAIAWGERLPSMVSGNQWSALNEWINYGVPLILGLSLAVIGLVIGPRDDLFRWLALALGAMAFGSLLSTVSGGRYTVGWYTWRLTWLMSACALFLYFMGQFTRQHGMLRQARDDLAERTRERDRIWNVSDDLLGVGTFDGALTSVNPAWTRLLGWSEDELRRMPATALRHPDDAAAATAARAQLAAGASTVRLENRVRHRDGSWRWIAWTLTADEGRIYFAGRHVTAEKEALEALAKAQAERAQMQKMEALGQLTGGVAHDFNNLLMIVTGHVSRLRTAFAREPIAARAVEAIEIAAHRGQSLTRQLLSFSRRQPINPRVIALGPAIEAARPMLSSSAGVFATFRIDLAADLWPVKVDINELELALVNLIVNARDAVGEGGSVTLTGRNVRLDAGMTTENLAGDFVALAVKDSGSGIPPDILAKVFEPFFTTKEHKGTGLGLSQVHGFCHRSGGTVAIDSAPGAGTSITLYLPRAHALPENAAPKPADAVAGGRALLIEDNPDVAEVSRDMLAELGYDVQTAHDAQRALGLASRHAFDLVVSDIVMPGAMNGLELARALRAERPALPIILMTGYAAAAEGAAAEFVVLRKPFGTDDLRGAIARVAAVPAERT